MSHLFVIATPIGNLEDFSARAIRVLSDCAYILAEDTRVTTKLLNRHNISANLISWHQHSKDNKWRQVKKLLAADNDLALVTDAGTPGVSDPGGKLIELVRKEFSGVQIVPIPGPSALTAAISVAGIPLNEFLFLGYLPHKKGRQLKLGRIKDSKIPVILFESKHRIKKLLQELALMKKQVIVFRELTKKFESIYRGSAKKILDNIPDKEIKGEFVAIVYT
jgi:16S rRNA (cytidine1402-2'-O)-methyltransferase